MYLKHLKISGFKSFGREIIFTFDKNLNIIVGPNGSGKSNIIDAVKWLLGEPKYKSMRLDHPDSVLFNGNDTLSAAKSAKVEMIIDNSDEEIVEFGKEFSIMRTYSKGDSRYYLDGKRVNLKNIKAFISDKGLGKEFYSIISQGKITELVKSGGKSMKNLLDQAAGISPFYQKKDEALRNLGQTEQNLLRIGDIIKEISARKNSLHLQAKRAEKYLYYKSLLNNFKATKIKKQSDRFLLLISESDKKISNISSQLEEKNKVLKESNGKLEEYRQKYSKIDKLMKDLTSAIDSLRSKEEKFNLKIDDINKKINEKLVTKDTLNYEISSNEETISSIDRRIADISSSLKKIENELQSKKRSYLEIEEKRKQITLEVDEIQKENFNIQEEIFKLRSQLSELKSGFESRDRELKNIDESMSEVRNEIKNNEYKINQSKTRMKDYLEKLKEFEKLDEKLKNKIREKEVLLHNLKHHFEDINSQLNDLNLSLSSLKEQLSMNQKWLNSYEGYSRAVKALFREIKRSGDTGIIDTVANILEPYDGYELAINALTSGRLQNVITHTSEDAKRAIGILRSLKAGRITFLPMDMLNSNTYSATKPLNAIDFAKNLVKYDQKYKKVIDFIFTNSVVVDNIDDAISLKKSGYRGRIATLKGDIIQPGGAITGGSVDEHSLNLINRQKILDELNEKISTIEKEMDEKTMKLSNISIKMNETIDEIKALKDEGNKYQSDYDKYKNQIDLYSDMISTYEENINKLKKKLQSLEKLKPDLKNEIDDLNSKLSYMESLIVEKEKERETIKEKMSSIMQNYKEIDEKTTEKRREYETIKNDYETKTLSVESLVKQKETVEDKIVNAKRNLNNLLKEIDVLNDDLFYLKQDINKVKDSINSKIEEMKSNSELKSKGAELLQSLREKVNAISDEIFTLKESLDKEKLNRKEYQVKFEDLQISLKEIQYDEIYENKSEKEINDSIKDFENKLKHIGTVNLNAFEEYKEVTKRYEEYDIQRKDILYAKEKIEELIKKLDEEARNKFIESLKKIQIHFNDMMDLLFNGGSGEIVLTNPEDVLTTEVDIAVKVPHKKIKSLYAMSGGEQTLIGVALMFAFLKTNPSPFYILDEIDANLDSANTERISLLLRKLSSNTQFIVITHNKIMMDIAKTIYGITMEKGLTKAIKVEV